MYYLHELSKTFVVSWRYDYEKMCMSQKITVEKSFHNISKNLMNLFDDIQMDILD